MKIEDLKVGTIYECRLSRKKVLVCEIEKEASKINNAKLTSERVKVKTGKFVVNLDSGDFTYKYDELFDGQLKELEIEKS